MVSCQAQLRARRYCGRNLSSKHSSVTLRSVRHSLKMPSLSHFFGICLDPSDMRSTRGSPSRDLRVLMTGRRDGDDVNIGRHKRIGLWHVQLPVCLHFLHTAKHGLCYFHCTTKRYMSLLTTRFCPKETALLCLDFTASFHSKGLANAHPLDRLGPTSCQGQADVP